MKRGLGSSIIASCLFVAGCQGARELAAGLGELQQVQSQVATAIGQDVSVNLNNHRYLTIGVVNSPLKALPEAQKEAKAREIALLAYKAFPSRTQLESVAVVFVTIRNFLVFKVTDATDSRAFEARELAASISMQSAP